MKKILSILSVLLFSYLLFAQNNLVFKKNYSISDISNLKINLSSEDIYFKTIYGDEISVEVFCNFDKKTPQVDLYKDTLTFSRKAKQTISGVNYECSIYIYIPEAFKFHQVEIELTSGDCKIEDLLASEGYFSFTSGDIKADYLEIPSLEMTFTSGDLKINEFRGQNLVSKSTSGNFTLDIFKGESFSIESTSGDTSLKNVYAEYFDIFSTSGNVELKLSQMIEATSRINTTSGEIELCVPKDSDFEITVDTSSGNFEDRITGRHPNIRDSYYKMYNNGGPAFELISTSGDITLYE